MTDVSLAPLVGVLTPYAIQLSAVVIAAGASWAAAQFTKATHIKVEAAALDKLTQAADAEAGALIAAADGNLAGVAVHVSNPMIAGAANRIIDGMPKVLDAAGVTPDRVATLVAGALGKLQATMPAALPAPTPAKAG